MSYLGSVRIYQDRYGGIYSRGGRWVAVDMRGIDVMSLHEIENGILGGDLEAMRFWETVVGKTWIATGRTPNDALAALEAQQQDQPRRLGWPPAPIAK
jgi:hypothetical protein